LVGLSWPALPENGVGINDFTLLLLPGGDLLPCLLDEGEFSFFFGVESSSFALFLFPLLGEPPCPVASGLLLGLLVGEVAFLSGEFGSLLCGEVLPARPGCSSSGPRTPVASGLSVE
jgi:hypothetical protein